MAFALATTTAASNRDLLSRPPPHMAFARATAAPPDRDLLSRPAKPRGDCGCHNCASNGSAGPARAPAQTGFEFTSIPLWPPRAASSAAKNSADDGAAEIPLLLPAAAPGVSPPSPLPPAAAPSSANPAPPVPAAPACPAGQSVAKATACIQPVVIADDDGTHPTTATSAATAVSVWGKCCETLSVSGTKTVNKTSFKTLEESPSNTPSADESALFAAAGASSCIQVFQPAMLKQGATADKDVSGGGGTYDGGTANPKIVLVEGAVPEVLAHEVGHALGHAGHDANATVMKPTGHYNVANATAVSADVCTKARTGSALTTGGTADCCETLP
jgi:hypothetical protein